MKVAKTKRIPQEPSAEDVFFAQGSQTSKCRAGSLGTHGLATDCLTLLTETTYRDLFQG
jgi:hypothetical protein